MALMEATSFHAPGSGGDEEPDQVVAPVFDRTVEEGIRRLNRTWPGLLATGWVGGMDVGVGIMALALVKQSTIGSLNHAIVMSLEMFAALQVGAPFGYLAWVKAFGVACAGNVIGGVGFVTVLRMIQVGRAKIEQEREAAEHES